MEKPGNHVLLRTVRRCVCVLVIAPSIPSILWVVRLIKLRCRRVRCHICGLRRMRGVESLPIDLMQENRVVWITMPFVLHREREGMWLTESTAALSNRRYSTPSLSDTPFHTALLDPSSYPRHTLFVPSSYPLHSLFIPLPLPFFIPLFIPSSYPSLYPLHTTSSHHLFIPSSHHLFTPPHHTTTSGPSR